MKKITMRAMMLAIATALAAAAHTQAADAGSKPLESGLWVTQSGNLEIKIAPCAQALCGTVIRVIANNSMSAPGATMTPTDTRSPLGMKILTDFVATGESEWKGRIYNRENGETYDCLMTLAAPDQLKIRAYKGLPIFGKTQLWKRVDDQQAAP